MPEDAPVTDKFLLHIEIASQSNFAVSGTDRRFRRHRGAPRQHVDARGCAGNPIPERSIDNIARFAEVVGADAIVGFNVSLLKESHMNACKVVELGDVKTETKCGTATNVYDCYPQKWA